MQADVAATTAVKALSDDGTRIGGYLIVYGSPAQKDLQGDWFDPSTELGLGWYERLPMLYHHGADRAIGGDLIGVIDTLRPDAVGVWAEGQLDKHHRYAKAVRKLVQQGALAWSSGSLPHLVQKDHTGHIKRWIVVEGSLTPTPAQPYTTTVSAIKSAYTALGLDTAHLESAIEEDALTDEIKHELAQTVNALSESVKSLRQEITRPQSPTLKRLPSIEAGGSTAPRIDVLRATKYSDLSASDMSFLADILGGSVRGWNPGEAFFRELADKTLRAVNNRELPYEAAKGLTQYTKANELDTVGQTGYGAEWAADSWRSQLWQKVRQDNVVAPLFSFVEMPTNPYELPFESSDPTVYFVPETTDTAQLNPSASPITASKVGSGKIQMSAKKLALRIAWSSELNEDSLIPIIANYRQQAIRAMQNAIDNVLINGDTATGANTNVNLIDGTPTTGTKYLAFDGLRKYALVTNTAQKKDAAGVAPSLTLLRQTRFLLNGAYATQPRQLAWVVDDTTYAALLALPEFLTMDKAGPYATAQTGQIGFIDGIPVFATAEMGLTNATGKISGTPANNVKGQAIIVFRPNFMIGYRRQVQANVEFFPWSDAYHLVVTVRLCMVNFDTTSAAELFNLLV